MNIGIDMDDTICSTSKMIEVYSNKYITENNITKDNLWNIKENKDKFLKQYLQKIYDEAHLKEGVRECFKELKKLGYNLYIITARTENYVEDINNTIVNYLKTNNLLVDGIFINSNDKVDICKNKNIDLMIEDNLYNYNMLKQNNINTILLDEDNKYKSLKNKVKNWYEVINIIKEKYKIN